MSHITPTVRILQTDILSDNWYTLRKVTFEIEKADGTKVTQSREAYDRGNGAVILLYNKLQNTVVLTRQFRIPTYINGNEDGMLIEACAGLLEKESPEECIKREAIEETGYEVGEVKKIFEAYMSPGSVTEILYFFIAEYAHTDLRNDGGGVKEEEENIQVLEIPFPEALMMIEDGRIKDGKTIMLLQYIQIHGLLAKA
ncbi:MAG: GDP-mannose pyrophosphatase NudK [Anaerolineales bacterium]|nr:GDP-mannose pyrophosphatase NudK [Anaerolineales bacterium]